uniref:Uncharacterized protein n=1 Tax=Siphoviridae sp. ctMCY8 TaxID=2827854 RepID=A0A8S5TA00_9CAUD|nr:MAG TPA: hypothetical protein [Siphoviridae sp. ctMCY8]
MLFQEIVSRLFQYSVWSSPGGYTSSPESGSIVFLYSASENSHVFFIPFGVSPFPCFCYHIKPPVV